MKICSLKLQRAHPTQCKILHSYTNIKLSIPKANPVLIPSSALALYAHLKKKERKMKSDINKYKPVIQKYRNFLRNIPSVPPEKHAASSHRGYSYEKPL